MRVIVLLLLVLSSSCVLPAEFPQPWRALTDEQLAKEPLRAESPNGYTLVEADFDGDGALDSAHIVRSTVHAGLALIVRLARSAGDEWAVLYETPAESPYVGINTAPAETHKTLCGKGYHECANGELPAITLAHEGIIFFMFESSSSIFYWDADKSAFIQFWTSD